MYTRRERLLNGNYFIYEQTSRPNELKDKLEKEINSQY